MSPKYKIHFKCKYKYKANTNTRHIQVQNTNQKSTLIQNTFQVQAQIQDSCQQMANSNTKYKYKSIDHPDRRSSLMSPTLLPKYKIYFKCKYKYKPNTNTKNQMFTLTGEHNLPHNNDIITKILTSPSSDHQFASGAQSGRKREKALSRLRSRPQPGRAERKL